MQTVEEQVAPVHSSIGLPGQLSSKSSRKAGPDETASDGAAADQVAEQPAKPEVPSITPDLLAQAAEASIQQKSIGERIKYLRQRKGMGLVELGRHTGLSASFLSQLETGRVVPTLRNLARIALVFSRDMSFFFEAEREDLFRIVRADERVRLPQTGAAVPGYFFESLGAVPNDSHIVPYIAEFLPADGNRVLSAHQHTGAEFLYLLSGTLQVTHGDRTEVFSTGDALYFHSGTTHSYQRLGEQPCTALILTMPVPQSKPRLTRKK